MTTESIKSALPGIPDTSGVYQFFDGNDQVIYVGKAKNLSKRIQSYTRKDQLSGRIARMVFLAQKVEFIQTGSEVEALLLEHNLIKKLSPRFNILLRDDKTFPQILITAHKFPRITKHRGSKSEKGSYFGPYASAHDVNHSIDILRKSFLLRNCSDTEFRVRKKPCLEYQIKKCTAPCVAMISEDDYKSSVADAISFLSGKSAEIQKNLAEKMQRLSEAQEYEKAAALRDKIKALNSIQTKQNINISELGDSDVITIVAQNGVVCIYISFFRNGQNCGAKPYFYEIENIALLPPSLDRELVGRDRRARRDKHEIDFAEKTALPAGAPYQNHDGNDLDRNGLEQILSDFLGQFYLSQMPAKSILLNTELPEKDSMEKFLEKISGKKVTILIPKSGQKASLIKDQLTIATQNLEQKVLQNLSQKEIFLEIKKIFDLPKIPARIEVYDNSHTSGTNAVGVLITAGLDGFIKSGYRKFNIGKDGVEWGGKDDTSMLREVLTRRFSKLEKKDYPDFIIIDGGKPQLSAAYEVFSELNIKIPLICMAKGENRNAGEEKFYRSEKNGDAENIASDLPKHHPVMHYLQRLRDEAHRFAIMTHRKKRAKAMKE